MQLPLIKWKVVSKNKTQVNNVKEKTNKKMISQVVFSIMKVLDIAIMNVCQPEKDKW